MTTTGGQDAARVPSERLKELTSENELRRYDEATRSVPRTMREAFSTFFSRASILLALFGAVSAVMWRIYIIHPHHPLTTLDAKVVVATSLSWILQEWFLHAKLLHSPFSWWGKDIHVAHHKMPYHHISLDGMKIVGPTMLLSFLVLRLLFKEDVVRFSTGLATFYVMGITYEWTHFLVHTKVPMKSSIAKVIKRAHVKHHLRDDRFWFSFTCPPLDNLMGTTPELFCVG